MICTNILLRATRIVHNLKTAQRFKSTFNRGIHFFFKKNLLFTNSITSGICMAVGDLILQKYEIHSDDKIKSKYDWARAGRMFIVGTVMGPLHHYYYIYLDRLLPKADLKTVLIKIVSDQLFAAPPSILCFFYGMGILENRTMKEMNEEVKDKFLYVFIGDCMFWPPVQFINFYYLPTHYRVFYINVVVILYDAFLSFMKHDAN